MEKKRGNNDKDENERDEIPFFKDEMRNKPSECIRISKSPK